MIWNDLQTLIKNNQSFLISSHQSLDGDCVGSQLAFAWYLKHLGKDVVIYNHDPVPAKFIFLKDSGQISPKEPSGSFDVVAILDCSNPGRLGWDGIEKLAPTIINIDHHRDNTRFGTLNIVETRAAATGELIYEFLCHTGITIPSHVAEYLYTAILTDTGGFRFSNTSSTILRVCSELIDKGAIGFKIYEQVYSSHLPRALKLQSRIWSTLNFLLDGKVCTMDMPMSVLKELNAQYSDSEGMVDYTITAVGVEVGMLTKHSENETHFSLRSRGRIDVGRIAQKIPGGGGHSNAAGCTVKLPYAQAMEHMLDLIKQELATI